MRCLRDIFGKVFSCKTPFPIKLINSVEKAEKSAQAICFCHATLHFDTCCCRFKKTAFYIHKMKRGKGVPLFWKTQHPRKVSGVYGICPCPSLYELVVGKTQFWFPNFLEKIHSYLLCVIFCLYDIVNSSEGFQV